MAAFVHYRDDGTIAPVEITAAGVGPRDARFPLPAEQYHRVDGARKTQGGSTTGFVVADVADGAVLGYRVDRDSLSASTRVNLTFANGGDCAGAAGVAVAGRALATCVLESTGAWDMYANVACDAALLGAAAVEAPASADGAVEVALSFAGCGGAAFAKLDTLTFA